MAQRLERLASDDSESLLRDDMIFHVIRPTGGVASFELVMRRDLEEALANGNPEAWKFLINILDQNVEQEDE